MSQTQHNEVMSIALQYYIVLKSKILDNDDKHLSTIHKVNLI